MTIRNTPAEPGQLPADPSSIPIRLIRSRPAGRIALLAANWGPWSTPVVLRSARIVTLVLIALAGALGIAASAGRAAAIDEINTRIAPRSADAAELYRALAATDAAMTSEFTDPAGDPAARDRPLDDSLAAVDAGLARAAGRVDDDESREDIRSIGAQLPSYTGLVEQARASRQAGEPAAESELRRAADLMQTSMLPVAETLQRRQALLLDNAYSGTGSGALALPAVGALLAILLTLQVWMARRFRRGLNLGLLLATAAVVIGVIGATTSAVLTAGLLSSAKAHTMAIDGGLVPAQVAADRARSAEGLALLAGGDPARSEQEFQLRRQQLADGPGSALGVAMALVTDPAAQAMMSEASVAAAGYGAAHEPVRQAVAAGRPADATELAYSADPRGPTSAYRRISAALAEATASERAAFDLQIQGAAGWQSFLSALSTALTLIAMAAVAVGIAARLKEYP